MGGGDLNLKKSWHPGTFRNQEKVWKEERKAADEEKKLQQLRKELEEERQIQELQRIQEQAGGKKRSDRLDWMYQAAPSAGARDEKDLEDYLLGKRRVDDILNKDSGMKALSKDSNSFMSQPSKANSVKDIQSKIREDPLLAIKRREQASMEALMKNPIKMRQLKEAKDPKKKKSKKSKEDKADKEERRKEKSERRSKRRSSRDRSDESDRRTRSPISDRYRARRVSPPPQTTGGSAPVERGIDPQEEARRKAAIAEERAKKLKAMTDDASAEDQARKARLAEIAEIEAKQDAEDEAKRMNNSKGGQASFMKSAQKSAYSGMSMADRVQRGRATLQSS
ncbi:RNA-splicing factor [Mortierella alpina]|nr:RNA-splicing factor [Mortierella alpina]